MPTATAAPIAGPSWRTPTRSPTIAPIPAPTSVSTMASMARFSSQLTSRSCESGPGSDGRRRGLLRQAIARAAHRLDQRGALHRRERLAQALDVDVHGALLDEHMVAPDAIEQL